MAKKKGFNPYNQDEKDRIDYIQLGPKIYDPNHFGERRDLKVQIKLTDIDFEKEAEHLGAEFVKKLKEKLNKK